MYRDYIYYNEINDDTILSLVDTGYFQHKNILEIKNTSSITD